MQFSSFLTTANTCTSNNTIYKKNNRTLQSHKTMFEKLFTGSTGWLMKIKLGHHDEVDNY